MEEFRREFASWWCAVCWLRGDDGRLLFWFYMVAMGRDAHRRMASRVTNQVSKSVVRRKHDRVVVAAVFHYAAAGIDPKRAADG